MDWISACISASVFSSGASLPLCQESALAVDATFSWPYSGAAFSFSDVFFDVLDFAFLPNICTYSRISRDPRSNAGPRTSNCHRSTCSPVSLLVMTTTSLDILLPYIHSFSCDMIFLMYALT
jgi:hypothetical protein